MPGAFDRQRLIACCKEGKTSFRFQYQRQKPHEEMVWILFAANIFWVPHSNDVECFVYTYDITEELRSRAITRRIAEMAFDSAYLIYLPTRQVEFLREAEGLAVTKHRRISYDAVCQSYRETYISREEWEQFDEAVSLDNIAAALRAGTRYSTTYRQSHVGRMECKQVDYVCLDRAAGIVLAGRSDVTVAYERDQKQLAVIEQARLEADKANEAKSAFLSSMSHDLRTPLNAILGFTNIALRTDGLAAKQEYLRKIQTSGDLLLDLVNDTLELSRIESGKLKLKLETLDGRGFWTSTIVALVPLAVTQKIELAADTEHFPAEIVRLDPLKVKKILLNLISNAIKYTPAGGRVAVSVMALDPPVKGATRRIVVEDNGIGMSPEFLGRMYEPFAQEHRLESENVAGTGLGLSIVSRIVQLMGGSIQATSELHKGTRFTVDLPIEHWPQTAAGGPVPVLSGESADEEDFAGQRVLLCEDNALNAEIATLLLQDKNLQADWARDGAEGVERFAAAPVGFYAAVLMDIRMPHLDGYAAAARIRQLDRPDAAVVPIVALTADAFEEDIRHSREAGMDAHLTKPFVPRLLYQTLHRLLDARS